MTGQRVFILGGGNSAGQAAVHLARFADRVTMIVRDSSLAVNMSDYLVKEVERHPKIEVWLNSEVVDGGGQGHLDHLVVAEESKDTPRRVPAEALFILIGAHPKTEWLPNSIERVGNGYVVTGDDLLDRDGRLPANWPLRRNPFVYETSVPGVFAAGDVRYHAVRRVASAVGEGAMTVHLIHQYLAQH